MFAGRYGGHTKTSGKGRGSSFLPAEASLAAWRYCYRQLIGGSVGRFKRSSRSEGVVNRREPPFGGLIPSSALDRIGIDQSHVAGSIDPVSPAIINKVEQIRAVDEIADGDSNQPRSALAAYCVRLILSLSALSISLADLHAQEAPPRGAAAQRAEEQSQPIFVAGNLGTLRTWLNRQGGERIPIREKPVLEGVRGGLIPPRTRREGIIPRVSLSTEYDDNVAFTSSNKLDDLRTIVSPGVSYANSGDWWRVNLDYSFESTFFLDNTDLNKVVDAQSGLLDVSFSTSPRTQIGLVNVFRETGDPTEQAIPGAVASGDPTTTNNLFVFASHGLDVSTNLNLSYGNNLQLTATPDTIEVTTHDVLGAVDVELTPRDRAGVTYNSRAFVFSGASDVFAQGATFDYRHVFSERFVAQSSLGMVYTTASAGNTYVRASGSLEASLKDTIFGIGFDRDLSAQVGLGSLLINSELTGSALVRLGPGWQLGTEINYSQFETVGGTNLEGQEFEGRATVSYALRDNMWARLKYTLTREDIRGQQAVTSNRLILSFVLSW